MKKPSQLHLHVLAALFTTGTAQAQILSNDADTIGANGNEVCTLKVCEFLTAQTAPAAVRLSLMDNFSPDFNIVTPNPVLP